MSVEQPKRARASHGRRMGSSQQYYNRYERPQAERDLPPPIRVIEERIEIRDGREFRVTVLS